MLFSLNLLIDFWVLVLRVELEFLLGQFQILCELGFDLVSYIWRVQGIGRLKNRGFSPEKIQGRWTSFKVKDIIQGLGIWISNWFGAFWGIRILECWSMCDDDSRTLADCLDIGFAVVFLSLLTSVCLIFVTWNIIFLAVLLGLRLRLNSDIK